MCADAIADPAHHPSDAIRPGVEQRDADRACGARSARSSGGSGSPTKSHLSMLLPACALQVISPTECWSERLLTSPPNTRCCGWRSVLTPTAPTRRSRGRHRLFRSARCTATRREWERQVDDHELRTSVDWRNGPLVRIVDVVCDAPQEEHDLVLTVSHVIADGTTALTLLRRLVEHAPRPRWPATPSSRPIIGAPEDLLPARYRGPRGIARLAATGLADGLATALAPGLAGSHRSRSVTSGAAEDQARPAHAYLDTTGFPDATVSAGRRHRARRARRRDGDGDRARCRAKSFGTNLHRLADQLPLGTRSSGLGRRGRQLREHGAVDSAFRWRP